jgi:hypothetical protein
MLQQFDAIHAGHFHVGQDQVHIRVVEYLKRFPTAVGSEGFKVFFFKDGTQDEGVIFLIVYDQNGIHYGIPVLYNYFDLFTVLKQIWAAG